MAASEKRSKDPRSAVAAEADHEPSVGRKVSKSEEIRRVAKELSDEGRPLRPREIVEILEAKGIKVYSSQVTTALIGTPYESKRRRDRTFERLAGESPSLAAVVTRQVSYEDLLAAREFVRKLGDIEKCISALVALKELQAGQAASGGGEIARQSAETAPQPSGQRWPAATELTSRREGERASS